MVRVALDDGVGVEDVPNVRQLLLQPVGALLKEAEVLFGEERGCPEGVADGFDGVGSWQ